MPRSRRTKPSETPTRPTENYSHPESELLPRPRSARRRSFGRRSRRPPTAMIPPSRRSWSGTGRTPPRVLGEWLLACVGGGRVAFAPSFPTAPRVRGRGRAALATVAGLQDAVEQLGDGEALPELGGQGRAPLLRRAHPAPLRPRAALHRGIIETLKGHQERPS